MLEGARLIVFNSPMRAHFAMFCKQTRLWSGRSGRIVQSCTRGLTYIACMHVHEMRDSFGNVPENWIIIIIHEQPTRVFIQAYQSISVSHQINISQFIILNENYFVPWRDLALNNTSCKDINWLPLDQCAIAIHGIYSPCSCIAFSRHQAVMQCCMKSIYCSFIIYLNNFINFVCLIVQEQRCRWNWNFRPNRMQRIYQMIVSGMPRKRRCYRMRTMTMKDLWAAPDRVWTTGFPWTASRKMTTRRRMNWLFRKTKRSTQTPPRNAVRRRSGWQRRGWLSWRSGGWRRTPVRGTGCTDWTTRSTSCASTCRAIRRRRSCRRSKLWDWRATTSVHWQTSWRKASNRKPSLSPKRYLAGCRRIRSTWSPVLCSWILGPWCPRRWWLIPTISMPINCSSSSNFTSINSISSRRKSSRCTRQADVTRRRNTSTPDITSTRRHRLWIRRTTRLRMRRTVTISLPPDTIIIHIALRWYRFRSRPPTRVRSTPTVAADHPYLKGLPHRLHANSSRHFRYAAIRDNSPAR